MFGPEPDKPESPNFKSETRWSRSRILLKFSNPNPNFVKKANPNPKISKPESALKSTQKVAVFSASLRKIASNQNIHNIMLEHIPKGSKIIFDTMIQFLSEEIQGAARQIVKKK